MHLHMTAHGMSSSQFSRQKLQVPLKHMKEAYCNGLETSRCKVSTVSSTMNTAQFVGSLLAGFLAGYVCCKQKVFVCGVRVRVLRLLLWADRRRQAGRQAGRQAETDIDRNRDTDTDTDTDRQNRVIACLPGLSWPTFSTTRS